MHGKISAGNLAGALRYLTAICSKPRWTECGCIARPSRLRVVFETRSPARRLFRKRKFRMSKVISAADPAALIKDEATIGASALILAGWPEEIAIAIETRFLATGHSAELTVVHASGIGGWATKGEGHFAHPGMVSRWMGGHRGISPDMAKMVLEGGCQGYCLPQGVVAQFWREIAGHRAGLITKTGRRSLVAIWPQTARGDREYDRSWSQCAAGKLLRAAVRCGCCGAPAMP